MEGGWIKIHRSIEEWEWESDPLMYYFWVRLLVKVNHEDKEWKGEIIPRGSMVTSLSKMATEFHLSVKQVRVFLARLTKGKQIVTETTNKWTKITICKYDDYQVVGQAEGQTKGKQSESNRATTKEEKKKEYIINTTNAPAREDWRFISSVRRTMLGNDKNRIAEHKISLFRSEVESIAPELGMTPQQIDAFVRWWTEHSPGNEKIRAEYEIAFDTKSRMQNWMARDKPRIQTSQPKSRMDQFEENMKFINDFFDGQYQQNAAPDEQ